jgi:hypothetical protein
VEVRRWTHRRERSRAIAILGAVGLALSAAACGIEPSGHAEQAIRAFMPRVDPPLSSDAVRLAEDAWIVEPSLASMAVLFEVSSPGVDEVRLVYRAELRAVGVAGPAYLEMLVRLPGRGTFFSKGLHLPLTGTTKWTTHEIPFFLQKGEIPDHVTLGIRFESPGGRVEVRSVQLLVAPL